MDLIPTLSHFNNRVGLWLKDHGLTQANAPIINPLYTVMPLLIPVVLFVPFPVDFLIAGLGLLPLALTLFRHELVRERNEEAEAALSELDLEEAPADLREFRRVGGDDV